MKKPRLIEAVLTIARLRGATSLDVQEALSVKWDRPSADFGLRRTLGTLSEYDLAYTTVQPIVLHQKIGLFRLTERGRTLARALGVEPIDNGWDTLVRTHQGETQVAHAALLLYTDRLARERGWLTELTPDESRQQFYPDLWISTGEWSMYVEVESRWRRAPTSGTSGGPRCGRRALPRLWHAHRRCGRGWFRAAGRQVYSVWRLTWKPCVSGASSGGWKRGARRTARLTRSSSCRV